MPTFGELLKERRKALRLTHEEFANLVGISKNYLADLEGRPTGPQKKPAIDKLSNIIQVASARTEEEAKTIAQNPHTIPWSRRDTEAARSLLFAALGLDDFAAIKPGMDSELEAARSTEELWIITDTIAEAQDDATASETALNIVDRKTKYRFFVPFAIDDEEWRRAVQRIETAAKAPVVDHLLVYKLSNCAFTSRLRISSPRSNPQGTYNVGGLVADVAQFEDAPVMLLPFVVKALDTLVTEYERAITHKAPSNQQLLFELPRFGHVERVYPSIRKARGAGGD